MTGSFIGEERGQTTLEYVLLVGGIIMTTVIIFSIYRKMSKAGFEKINESTDAVTSAMSSRISAEVANIY